MTCVYSIDPEAVRKLVGADEDTDLSEYIASARSVIDTLLNSCAAGQWDGVIASRLGTWLAAHFYAVIHPTLAMVNSRSANGASVSYNRRQAGNGFSSTPYGLNAIQMDPTNCLAEYSEKATRRRAKLFFGGNCDGDSKRNLT